MQALTDRPLRLVASLFWFVCAVLLLVRGGGSGWGGLRARFPRVSSSTSTVVFWLSQTGKALDSASLASSGGAGGRRIDVAGGFCGGPGGAGPNRGCWRSSEAARPLGPVRPRVFPGVARLAPLAALLVGCVFAGS